MDESWFIKMGRRFHRRRQVLYLPFAFISVFCFWKETKNELILWPIGLGLMMLGLWLRLWAIKYCGKRTIYKAEKGKWFTRQGPYAYVRNPLYLSNIIMGCGLITLSKLLWLIPIFIMVAFWFYHLITLYEESRLAQQFTGDYEVYRSNVRRWIPRFRSFTPAPSEGNIKTNPWDEIFKAERWRVLITAGMIILLGFKQTLGDLIRGSSG